MYTPHFTKRFKKDVELMKKQGKKLEKIMFVMTILTNAQSLPAKYRDHKLVGDYIKHNECHIEPDWLLIYRIEENCIFFERTGSHAALFK